jgi:hypothetical protein
MELGALSDRDREHFFEAACRTSEVLYVQNPLDADVRSISNSSLPVTLFFFVPPGWLELRAI